MAERTDDRSRTLTWVMRNGAVCPCLFIGERIGASDAVEIAAFKIAPSEYGLPLDVLAKIYPAPKGE